MTTIRLIALCMITACRAREAKQTNEQRKPELSSTSCPRPDPTTLAVPLPTNRARRQWTGLRTPPLSGGSPRAGLRRRSHRPACLISDRFAERHHRNVGTSDRHHGRMLDQREAPAKINSVFRSRAAQRDQANVVAFTFRIQRFQRVMLVLP